MLVVILLPFSLIRTRQEKVLALTESRLLLAELRTRLFRSNYSAVCTWREYSLNSLPPIAVDRSGRQVRITINDQQTHMDLLIDDRGHYGSDGAALAEQLLRILDQPRMSTTFGSAEEAEGMQI